MIDFRPHKNWIMLLAGALIVTAASSPLIGVAREKAEARLSQTRAASAKAIQDLQQLQDDIATTQKLEKEIDASDVEKSLAPIDRLRAAKIIERRAGESRLSSFTYQLSPETRVQVDTVGAGVQNLAVSKLALSGDAPTDLDCYLFLDALRRTLPGRFTLRQLALERIGAGDRPVSAANLHFTATGEWMSNGSGQKVSENDR